MIVAAHAGIHELDDHFLADAFEVAIAPVFKRESRSFSAAFFYRPLVTAAAGMRINLVGRAVHNVDTAAVGFPTGDSCREVFVGVFDAAVMLFFKFVFFGIGRRIASLPEGFYELVALFVVGKLFEGFALFVGNNVDNVFVEPLFISLAEFLLEGFGVFFLLLFADGALQWVGRLARLA